MSIRVSLNRRNVLIGIILFLVLTTCNYTGVTPAAVNITTTSLAASKIGIEYEEHVTPADGQTSYTRSLSPDLANIAMTGSIPGTTAVGSLSQPWARLVQSGPPANPTQGSSVPRSSYRNGVIIERPGSNADAAVATRPETAANVISFTATPTTIAAGQTATLTPVFDNAASAFIVDASYNNLGTVVSGGASIVTPSSTTSYELIVDGTGGERVTRSVTVNVISGFAQFLQQGPKLVATDAIGNALQGRSVSISSNGNTAIVGGPADGSGAGAAWIWTRSGGVWSQGPKLVGSGAFPPNPGFLDQGCSVSISSDGNTALVGGCRNAAWVWKRNGEVWTQQGPKLAPTIPSCGGLSCQSIRTVALSADGNTAILGGFFDDANPGVVSGAWVWTRSGEVWTQQGPMLVGSGAVSPFGSSVSLSADGNTAIVGAAEDNNFVGAAWVWTRSGGVWTQQGPKLVGSGAVGGTNGGNGTALQGSSVSLSADGNTAIIGGPADGCCPASNDGAVWIWTRSGGVWTQQGPKLVGPGGASISTVQGFSVSLSPDGNTAIVGGVTGFSQTSCVLFWTRSGGVWTHQGTKLMGAGAIGLGDGQQPGVSVALSADGKTAIVGGYNDNGGAGTAWVFAAAAPGPVIESIDPASVLVNQATTLTVNGNNFQSGFSANITTSAGTFPIPSAGLTFVSSNQVRVQVTMGSSPAIPYTTTLKITNPDAQFAVKTFDVVNACSLNCSATVQQTGHVAIPVSFSASATTGAGCQSAPTYEWDFGDGSPVSSIQNPSHIYSTSGTFSWTLTVRTTGANGQVTCVKQGSIVVDACTLVIPNSTRSFSADGGPGTLTVAIENVCQLTTTSLSNWIRITNVIRNQNQSTITYEVEPNVNTIGRTGAIEVGTQQLSIVQAEQGCNVSPLAPIVDPLALQFESANGNIVDLADLDPGLKTDLSTFTSKIAELNGTFIPSSGYRPPAYQAHLLDVWNTYERLLNRRSVPCSGFAEVEAEFKKHGLVHKPAPGFDPGASKHTKKLAFDVSMDKKAKTAKSNDTDSVIGLTYQQIDALANAAGLVRRVKGDPVHFELINPPTNSFGTGFKNALGWRFTPLSAGPVAVFSFQEILGSLVRYHYIVVNNSDQPIVSLKIGYDGSQDLSELSGFPIDWNDVDGLPSTSVVSPNGWTANLIGVDESDFNYLSWNSTAASKDIVPGETMTEFTVVLSEVEDTYRLSHWTVILGNSVILSDIIGEGKYGDVNSDQIVNVSDLLTMANILAGNLKPSPAQHAAADVFQDGTGRVNIQDLFTLANWLAGNIKSLPVVSTSSAVPDSKPRPDLSQVHYATRKRGVYRSANYR